MLVETSHTLQDPAGKTLYEAWKHWDVSKQEAKEARQVTDFNLGGYPYR